MAGLLKNISLSFAIGYNSLAICFSAQASRMALVVGAVAMDDQHGGEMTRQRSDAIIPCLRSDSCWFWEDGHSLEFAAVQNFARLAPSAACTSPGSDASRARTLAQLPWLSRPLTIERAEAAAPKRRRALSWKREYQKAMDVRTPSTRAFFVGKPFASAILPPGWKMYWMSG